MTGSMVCLNMYELNPVFELLNQLVLRKKQMGIFHYGVEIHGFEFAFVFIANSCETGVRQYVPKQSITYKFCESIDIGWTTLSVQKMKDLIMRLAIDWPARSYHIARRNCLHFAETLIDALGLRQQFPQWLKGANETALKLPGIGSVVDGFWGCATWSMAAHRPVFDCKMCSVCHRSLSVDQVSRCCAENSESIEIVQQRSLDSVINEEESAFQASDRATSCECNTLTLGRKKPICGVSIRDDGSQCVVYSFARIGVGKAEICFEFIQTAIQHLEEPKKFQTLVGWRLFVRSFTDCCSEPNEPGNNQHIRCPSL